MEASRPDTAGTKGTDKSRGWSPDRNESQDGPDSRQKQHGKDSDSPGGRSMKELLRQARKERTKKQQEAQFRTKTPPPAQGTLSKSNFFKKVDKKAEPASATAPPPPRPNGVEAIVHDMELKEGFYGKILLAYGLTGQDVVRFELLGVEKQVVQTLRALFVSLDKDGGGELSSVELYEALTQFGQNITDDDVTMMMEEVDTDNSGTIDFSEFVLLAIPGFSKTRRLAEPRGFELYKTPHAMFEDCEGCGEAALRGLDAEIPEQCFLPEIEEVDHLGRPLQPEGAGAVKLFLELRLRFKKAVGDGLARTQSAREKNIVLNLTQLEDCWIEQVYPYDDKQLVRGVYGAGIIFSAPPPPDPNEFPSNLSKLRCVKFPPTVAVIMEDGYRVPGFRIVTTEPQLLQITFDMKYGRLAEFPPPPNELTIIQSGRGTTLDALRELITSRSFLPRWAPLNFICKIPNKDRVGEFFEYTLKDDLGELYDLPRKTSVGLHVHMPETEERVKALTDFEVNRFSWTPHMRSCDVMPKTQVLCDFELIRAATILLEPAQKKWGHIQLAACFTDQVPSRAPERCTGWISCPPHPHVLPLVMHAGPNITIHPSIRGVSGTFFAHSIRTSDLTRFQRRLSLLMVGVQTAWALEHMHSQGIWHLDVKPDNLVVEVKGTPGNLDDDLPLRERINVRLADFCNCSAHAGSNITRRGTPSYWSPEQINVPTKQQHTAAKHAQMEAARKASIFGQEVKEVLKDGTVRAEYWGGGKCHDPPQALDCDMSDKSDSWGWATTMLSLMGRLVEMRNQGHTKFMKEIVKDGYKIELNGMFAYEHEPYIEGLQVELAQFQTQADNIQKDIDVLEEEIAHHWHAVEPYWYEAEMSLKELSRDDLIQITLYRRSPTVLRNVIDCVITGLGIEEKNLDWNRLRMFVGHQDFIDSLLKFEKTKGFSSAAVKLIMKYQRQPTFNLEFFTERNIPNADASKPGLAYKVCYALGAWIEALMKYSEARRTTVPSQMSMRDNKIRLDKMLPKLNAARDKLTKYTEKVHALKKSLAENTSRVITIMLTRTRVEAQQLVSDIMGMDGTLTDQQYYRLMRDVHLSQGEHALVFRRFSSFLPEDPDSEELAILRASGTVDPYYHRKDHLAAHEYHDEQEGSISLLDRFPFLKGDITALPMAAGGENWQTLRISSPEQASVASNYSPGHGPSLFQSTAPNIAHLAAGARVNKTPMTPATPERPAAAPDQPSGEVNSWKAPPSRKADEEGTEGTVGHQMDMWKAPPTGSVRPDNASGSFDVSPGMQPRLDSPEVEPLEEEGGGNAQILRVESAPVAAEGKGDSGTHAERERSTAKGHGVLVGQAGQAGTRNVRFGEEVSGDLGDSRREPMSAQRAESTGVWSPSGTSRGTTSPSVDSESSDEAHGPPGDDHRIEVFQRGGSFASQAESHREETPHGMSGRATPDHEHRGLRSPSTGVRTLTASPEIQDEDEDAVPPQHARGEIVNKRLKGLRGVGDPLLLAIAWCLQRQPVDRMPISALCIVLNQLLPGQQWSNSCTVLGPSGLTKSSAENDHAARSSISTSVDVAEALGAKNTAGRMEILSLMERRGSAMEVDGRLIEARDGYCEAWDALMKVRQEADQLEEPEDRDKMQEGLWVIGARIAMSVARVYLELDSYVLSMEWYARAQDECRLGEQEGARHGRSGGSGGEGGLVLSGGDRLPTPDFDPQDAVDEEEEDERARSRQGMRMSSRRQRERALQLKKFRSEMLLHKASVQLAKGVDDEGNPILRQAMKAFVECIRMHEKTMGPTYPDIAKAQFSIGVVRERQGRLKEALQEYERALDLLTHSCGYDGYSGPASMGEILEALSRVNWALGRTELAVMQFTRAKNIYAASVGSDRKGHPGVGRAMVVIGKICTSEGRYAEAAKHLHEALDYLSPLVDELAGADVRARPRNHAGALIRAAEVLQERGYANLALGKAEAGVMDFHRASELYKEALTGSSYAKNSIEDHTALRRAQCFMGMGSCYDDGGDHWKAVEAFQIAYQLRFSHAGHDRIVGLAECCDKLGVVFWRIERNGIAMDWFKRALTIREFVQGDRHPDVALTLVSMSSILRSQGQLAFAGNMSARIIKIILDSCGSRSVMIAQCLADIAVCKYPQLQEEHERLAGIRQEKLGVQYEAEDEVKRWHREVDVRQAKLNAIKKKTTVNRVMIKGYEESVDEAHKAGYQALAHLHWCQQEAATALTKFERVETRMKECVAMLYEAMSTHTDATPGSVRHWEKQVQRVAHKMEDDVEAAKARVVVKSPATPGGSPQDQTERGSSPGSERERSPGSQSGVGTEREARLGETAHKLKTVRAEIGDLETERERLKLRLKELLGDDYSVSSTPRSSASNSPFSTTANSRRASAMGR